MDHAISPEDIDEIRARLSAKIPFDKKWEILKPVIRQLWIDEDRKLSELIQYVESSFGFSANESQYKYRFKKWKWNKKIPASKKEQMVNYRSSLAATGRSAQLKYKGKAVEDKKLLRYLKQNSRSLTSSVNANEAIKFLTGSAFQLGSSIFLNWNSPLMGQGPSSPIDSPMQFSTPSNVEVATPEANNALSPMNAPSPLTKAKRKKEAITRAYMLIDGRYRDLVDSMNQKEKEVMSIWLYQFWLFGFKTAKHWGRGPYSWNASDLRFDDYFPVQPLSLPGANKNLQSRPGSVDGENIDKKNEPSPLCRWSIHYESDIKYEEIRSRTPSPEPDPLSSDEKSWKPWPKSLAQQSCGRALARGLASNNFSNVEIENIPVAVPQIIETAENSNVDFLEEALGFSIMARNYEKVDEIFDGLNGESMKEIFEEMNPLHLALTFIDGSKACCLISDILCSIGVLRSSELDKHGHTVFDKLMLAILKAHTSILPGMVDDGLRNEKRFPGEEVDICGRWDADSDCIRMLLARGDPCIPFAWKHKFCHTAVQVVCHCIEQLSSTSWLSLHSGLFVKRCTTCGLKMELGGLHLLVLVAVSLAEYGTKDEDLFGMLAVLLSTLMVYADPLLTANISVSALFPEEQTMVSTGCDHEKLTPMNLADRVPTSVIEKWPQKVRLGWHVFCLTLQQSQREFTTGSLSDDDDDDDNDNDEDDEGCTHDLYLGTCFKPNKKITQLHAAVQTEYLTYRRIREGDPWLSPNFDMLDVYKSLQPGNEITLPLVKNGMMIPVCICGRFQSAWNYSPRAEQVMSYHFSNLEDWSRTTFIPSVGSYRY